MRVVVLGTRGFPGVQGGVERHCEELYPRIVGLGCEVTVITRTPYISPEKRIGEWKGVRFIHLWCPKKRSFEAITHTLLGLLRVRQINPDILHLHGIGPALLSPLAKIFGLKVVMTHHGPDYKRAKWGDTARRVLKHGEKSGVVNSDAVISISRGIREEVKGLYGREAIFIPNGVKIPEPVPPGEELRLRGLEPRQYIFTAARFVEEKGLHDLIDAYLTLKSPEYKLVIAGDADHETGYSRNLKKKGSCSKGVVLTGFLSGKRLWELFSNASFFVLPSYYEGLPIALLEALSYGLPAVISDIPQHRELDLNAQSYFKAGDTAGLAIALSTALEGGFEAERGRYINLLKAEYDWDAIAVKTCNVYRQILTGRY